MTNDSVLQATVENVNDGNPANDVAILPCRLQGPFPTTATTTGG